MKPNAEHFDRWSRNYDFSLRHRQEFPLLGYDTVLLTVRRLALVQAGMSVLDLGTGTGNLAGHFLAVGCAVWATDWSGAMLGQAKAKHPGLRTAISNLTASLPPHFPARYDRVVSTYAFHHLDLQAKTQLVLRLLTDHVFTQGRLVIGDVAFETAGDRRRARSENTDRWDDTEFYWAADETVVALRRSGVAVRFEPVSSCGGVFVFESSDAG